MDLRSIVDSTRKYNFHSHTQFCDGRDTMEAIARSAVESGFVHLGFTPHSPVDILSPCNMDRKNVGAYLAEVSRLDRELPVSVYAGMEIDYLGPGRGPAAAYYQDLGLDFSIGSVHFIPSRRGDLVDIDGPFDRFRRNMADVFDNDLRYVVETFYDQSARMLAEGCFDILGHFDKIVQNAALYSPGLEQQGWYNDLVDSYIAGIVASGVIVEINTKARTRLGRFFPHERYWKRLRDAGVTLMVNSDVHEAPLVNASRDEVFAMLDSVEYGG